MDPIFKKIVIPIDGSDASINAAKKAIQLAKNLKCKTIIVHVINNFEIKKYVEVSNEDDTIVKKELQDYGFKYLEHVKGLAKRSQVPVEIILTEGIPAEKIVEIAENENADLIVMGSSGGTGYKKRILGSTTDRVVRWSRKIPVLVY